LIPRSMCSEIPKPKLPVSEKFRLFSSYSLTFRPRSRISSALGPRTVTWTEIFSLRRIPKVRTVYLALPMTVSQSFGRGSTHTVNWSLTAQLFKHFGSSSKSITRFTDRDVENQFLDSKLSHGIARLVFRVTLTISVRLISQ
jgi:hypothetical protein